MTTTSKTQLRSEGTTPLQRHFRRSQPSIEHWLEREVLWTPASLDIARVAESLIEPETLERAKGLRSHVQRIALLMSISQDAPGLYEQRKDQLAVAHQDLVDELALLPDSTDRICIQPEEVWMAILQADLILEYIEGETKRQDRMRICVEDLPAETSGEVRASWV